MKGLRSWNLCFATEALKEVSEDGSDDRSYGWVLHYYKDVLFYFEHGPLNIFESLIGDTTYATFRTSNEPLSPSG